MFDLFHAERVAAERVALDVQRTYEDADTRLKAWTERTGSGKSSFYRRLKELWRDDRVNRMGHRYVGKRATLEFLSKWQGSRATFCRIKKELGLLAQGDSLKRRRLQGP